MEEKYYQSIRRSLRILLALLIIKIGFDVFSFYRTSQYYKSSDKQRIEIMKQNNNLLKSLIDNKQ